MAKRTGSTLDQMQKMRGEISEIKERLACCTDPLVPLETACARIDSYVENMAERGAVDSTSFATQEGHVSWLLPSDVPGLRDFMAWLDPERLKERLKEGLESIYELHGVVIDTPELKQDLTRAHQDLFRLECEEERLIQAAEQSGSPIVRRSDADPRAILEAAP